MFRDESPLPPKTKACPVCNRPWGGHDNDQCLPVVARRNHPCPTCGVAAGDACSIGWICHQARLDAADVAANEGWHWMMSTRLGEGMAEPCLCARGHDHDEAGAKP